jgi:hypothetical protein
LLVEERYREAFDYLYHSSHEWTPQLIETLIHNYGSIHPRSEGMVYRVTPLETATGELVSRQEVTRDDEEPTSGDVWFDLPLNGGWSYLTATLFFQRQGDALVLELNDLHVM